MKTIKLISFFIVNLALTIAIDRLISADGLNVSWIVPAVGAALGIASSLFGGKSDEEIQYENYMKSLEDAKGEAYKQKGKDKGDMARMINAEISKRRSGASAVAASTGKDDPGFAWTKEDDLAQSKMMGDAEIDKNFSNTVAGINDKIATAKLGKPVTKTPLEKAFTGGLAGANLGFDITNALGIGGKGTAGTGGGLAGMLKGGNTDNSWSSLTPYQKKKKLNSYGSMSMTDESMLP